MKERVLFLMMVLIFTLGSAGRGFAAEHLALPAAQEVQDAKGASVDASAEELEKRLNQTINLEYKDADLSSVLRSMAWAYKLNIVTSSDIKGKVSINLQNISVERALEAILTTNGLVYSKRSGVIYVSAGDTNVVEVTTEVIVLKYLAATQAQNLLRKLLSSKGDLKINEAANTIIITDYAANIQKIKVLLQKIDLAPKQVLIEAKIVDITSNDLRALGSTWNVDFTPTKGGLFARSSTQEELKGGVALPQADTNLGAGHLVLNTLTLKGINITGTIDALVRNGKANLLASPSIAVINGQEAKIVIGERFPYKERTQTTSGTTETTKFVDIGTTLKVNPQINDDGYITLNLHPEVSSLLQSLDAGPRITTREADTTVRVKEGETLVIGGLIKQTDNSNRDRIPGLGNLPVLGHLFSRSSVDKEQTELAVFITPRILYSREEQLALGKKTEELNTPPELLVDGTSTLTIVNQIFQKAAVLDRGEGVESAGKNELFQKTQALSHYEVVYKEFPESRLAPEARYRAGLIYWDYFGNSKKAKETLAGLISDYPKSPFADDARKIYNRIEQEEKNRESRVKHNQ